MHPLPPPQRNDEERLMDNLDVPMFIGFRLLNTPKPMIGFICDGCLKPQLHPDNGRALQRCQSNCCESDECHTVYDLLIVGDVPGRRDLPFAGDDAEVGELSKLLAFIPRSAN